MVNDDSSAAVTTLINDLRAEVAALRDEIHKRDAERAQAARTVIATLIGHFDPLHHATADRIGALEERISDVEGQLDVTKLLAAGDTAGPSIRAVYQDVDRAARRATREGKEQRVDIPDGDHAIIAHIQPGTDAATVIREIGSAS